MNPRAAFENAPGKRDVTLKTPCCGRKVKPAFNSEYAVFSYKRVCPRCRIVYGVLVKPVKSTTDYQIHTAEWFVNAEESPRIMHTARVAAGI